MKENDLNEDVFNDLDFGGNKEAWQDLPEEESVKFVEENLWTKLERVGKKISFAKDIIALVNYMRDPYVSWHRKAIVAGALIYFISPIDTVPDIAPLIGYLDDLGVITALMKYLGSELTPYYQPEYRS
jgi:uncharacterized membrane protein YkvA (DUF1232 family)